MSSEDSSCTPLTARKGEYSSPSPFLGARTQRLCRERSLQLSGNSHRLELISGGAKLNSRQAAAEAVRLLGKFERSIVMKEFGVKHSKLFQKLLRARFNFDDTEVGHFTASRILSAHDDGAYPKVAVKRVRTRAEALKHKKARDIAKAQESYRNVLVTEAASVLGE